MRNLRLLGLFAPVLLLGALPLACEDSSSSGSSPFTPEPGPGFEAGSTPVPEAGLPGDTGTDSPVEPPPPPAGATVSVFAGTTPSANVRVVFQDLSGAVIGEKTTDATGKVSIAPAPRTVTVLAMGSNGGPAPVTFFAVADGDNLVVHLETVGVEEAAFAHYSVTFPPTAAAPIPNAFVTAGAGCTASTNATSTPLVVDLYAGCLGATNAVLAEGRDVDNTLVAFGFKKAVAKPAANATDAVALPSWTAPVTVTMNGVNRPAGGANLDASLWSIANGATFPAPNGSGSLDDGGVGFKTANGFPEAFQSLATARIFGNSGQSQSGFLRREAVPATLPGALPTFDFATALPFLTNFAIDATTVARPTVNITSGSLAAVDAGVVTIGWTTTQDSNATWTFVVPPAAVASFQAPALPANATDFAPVGPLYPREAAFFDATLVPGYTQAKALPVTQSSGFDLDPSRPLPANGTVRVTTWQPAQL